MPVIKVGDSQDVFMVVDSEAMLHRAYHAFTNQNFTLKTSSGLFSGAFHGFFNMLYNQIQKHSPKDIVFCWGDKRDNLLRKNLYPLYKQNRSDSPKEGFDEQLLDVQRTLYAMGFTQYKSDGYEGDDVVSAVVAWRLNEYASVDPKLQIVILSTDKDILQLVNDRVKVCHVSSSNSTEYTEKEVIEKYLIPPSQLADYFCMVGDENDGVPGIEGIGPKTASSLLIKNGPISNWFNKIGDIDAGKSTKMRLQASRPQLVRNKKLVSLVYNRAPLNKLTFNEKVEPDLFFDKYEETKVRPFLFIE